MTFLVLWILSFEVVHMRSSGDSEIGFMEERCVEGGRELDPFAVMRNDVAPRFQELSYPVLKHPFALALLSEPYALASTQPDSFHDRLAGRSSAFPMRHNGACLASSA